MCIYICALNSHRYNDAKTFRTILDKKLSLLPKFPGIYNTWSLWLMKKNYETLGMDRNNEEKKKKKISNGEENIA